MIINYLILFEGILCFITNALFKSWGGLFLAGTNLGLMWSLIVLSEKVEEQQ